MRMSGHVVGSTTEFSAFMKAGVMAGTQRDTGFCSGGDEDDMSGLHSPSASEDSVEVQISPISLRNKRKLAEPRKLQEQQQSTAPLKKRRFEHIIQESTTVVDEDSRPSNSPSPSPFRPWSSPAKSDPKVQQTKTQEISNKRTDYFVTTDLRLQEERWLQEEARRREEEAQRQHEARIQEEVLARLQESEARRTTSPVLSQTSRSSGTSSQSHERQRFQPPPPPPPTLPPPPPPAPLRLQEEPLALVLRGDPPRVPAHPAVSGSYDRTPYIIEPSYSESSRSSSHRTSELARNHQNGQRNYKNMTRERRIEANARERTRVHTISAAFDTLRRSIPAYSHNQKLSKLSVLRIACSYIMTLSKIANTPEGEETTSSALGACVDMVSRTIQTEGKLRKKKDE